MGWGGVEGTAVNDRCRERGMIGGEVNGKERQGTATEQGWKRGRSKSRKQVVF